jgi:phosphatidate cytidylyltransferase
VTKPLSASNYKKDPALWPRLLTAALLAPIAVFCVLYLSTRQFALIVAAVLLLGTWEFSRIVGLTRRRLRMAVVVLNAILLGLIWIYASPMLLAGIVYLGALWWWVALIWLRKLTFAQAPTLENAEIKLLAGAFLVIPAFAATILTHEGDRGPLWMLFVLMLIWVADSGAYFAGRRFGKQKLAPQISPGKTREGVYGGLFVAGLFACAFGLYMQRPIGEITILCFLSLLTVMFSIVGDLFESLMKRHANLKDSGSLLPGHGGVLDRIDSLLAALPVFAAGKLLFGL